MGSPFVAEGVWRALNYDEAWAPFDDRFAFRADYFERDKPAIALAPDALVVDLSPVFAQEGSGFEAGQATVNASSLRAFVALAGTHELTALDWQHTPYRYSPSAHARAAIDPWPIPVFPDGDYYAHFSAGVAWGTFGHPWQQTLTIWGDVLVRTLGVELLTWLPRHSQSPV